MLAVKHAAKLILEDKAKVVFTGPHPSKVLAGYVSSETIVYDTLNKAQEACKARNDCHGVTQEDSFYTLRTRFPLIRKVQVYKMGECMNMRELEVYGYNNVTNLARGKNAIQSGTLNNDYANYGALKAVDGNNNTFSHTNSQWGLVNEGKFHIPACIFLKYHV